MLTVYDANNWARRQLEVGRSVKDCVEDIRHSPAPTIVVWDGFGGNERRRADYPEYKMKRQPLTENMQNSFKFIRELLPLTSVIQMRIEGYEADDVIAQISRSTKDSILLYSRDMDLAALQNVRLAEDREFPCNTRLIRLYKTLVGDPADNIPGLKGFGKKAWEKLTPFDYHTLQQAFAAGDLQSIKKLSDEKLLERIKASEESLLVFWKIIGFYPIPDDMFNEAAKVGANDLPALQEIYARYML